MSFLHIYHRFSSAHEKANKAYLESVDYFERFDLEYSLVWVAGDGVGLLDHKTTLIAALTLEQVEAFSRAKSKKAVLEVLKTISFTY